MRGFDDPSGLADFPHEVLDFSCEVEANPGEVL